MRKFLLFIGGLVALFILIANLGPMILLGVGIWLLYIVFKKFVRSNTTGEKIGWVILGLVALSFTISNIYALVGLVAAYVIYLIWKNWNKADEDPIEPFDPKGDSFMNFEEQWDDLNRI